MRQNDACFSSVSTFVILQNCYTCNILNYLRNMPDAYYSQILTGYFSTLWNRKCFFFRIRVYRCVSRTRVARGRAHAQCNDANCGRFETKVFARAICGRHGSRGSGFQLRVFSDWQTRARASVSLSAWPVAHSKFGSWAVSSSSSNETFAAHRKLPLAPHRARTQVLSTVRLYISLLLLSPRTTLALSLAPHPPRTVSFFVLSSPHSPHPLRRRNRISDTYAPALRGYWHNPPYAIIGSRCGKIFFAMG